MKTAEKQYVIGRRDTGDGGLLLLGRYLALDGSVGAPVYLDALKPHAVLICGKRGYGKSYTLGAIVEEFAGLPPAIKKNFSVIVVDTMGIFGCMGEPNTPEALLLKNWQMAPEGIEITHWAPVKYLKPGQAPFEIPTGSLSEYDYCELRGIEPLGEHAAALIGAMSEGPFSMQDLIDRIKRSGASEPVKSSLGGLLAMVDGWRLFSKDAAYSRLLLPGSINIIDLSGYGHDPQVKSCIVASLARSLYDIRVKARREETEDRRTPLIWMCIDEAHMFMDCDKKSGAGEVLINEWLRQGRQPGLSLVLATQRPSALGKDVLSQADVIISHRLTLRDDVETMESARPLYVKEPVREALSRLGTARGAAIVIDDTTETYHVIRVRPRISMHGGGEPVVRALD